MKKPRLTYILPIQAEWRFLDIMDRAERANYEISGVTGVEWEILLRRVGEKCLQQDEDGRELLAVSLHDDEQPYFFRRKPRPPAHRGEYDLADDVDE